jgi:TonB family protein
VSRFTRINGCAVLALALASGCQHAATGTAAFAFVDPGHEREPGVDASDYKITEGTSVFVDAKPIPPLAMPAYPARALAARAGTVWVHVTVTIGADGLVSDISPNRTAVDIPTRFDEDFQESIRAALLQWRFEPAQVADLEPRAGDAPFVADSRDVESKLGVVFTFSSSGNVSSSSPKGANGR